MNVYSLAIEELNGKTVGAQQIKVAEARPQQPREQRGYQDRGGRGRY